MHSFFIWYMENKENKRPTLNDPQEWALIRSIYFEKDNFSKEALDPIERLDRMESRERNNLISAK